MNEFRNYAALRRRNARRIINAFQRNWRIGIQRALVGTPEVSRLCSVNLATRHLSDRRIERQPEYIGM
jgi:hypothetical protein